MNQDFKHKNFSGSCEISIEDDCLYGRILFIEDIISYEGQTITEIRAAFEEAVDDYLELCQQEGTEPNKPFSGSFNVRVGPMLHRACAISARRAKQTLNEFVTSSLQTACNAQNEPATKHINHYIVINSEDPDVRPTVARTSSPKVWSVPHASS